MKFGTWDRLRGSPPLAYAVRSAIAEQAAVTWVLASALLIALFAAVMIVVTVGLSEPTRFVPLLLFLTSCLWLYRLKHERRWRAEAESARLAKAASELAFHAVFDRGGTALALLTSSGNIEQLNHRALSLFGSTGGSLVGQAFAEAALWTDAQRPMLRDAIMRTAAGERSQHELTVTHRESVRRVIQLTFSPYCAPGGGVGHVVAELADVTDLIETRTMLAAARRLEALGKLSGGVAHDINNMLGAILNGSELVLLGLKSNDARRITDSAELIQASVVRAASLTKQLLAFGRKDRWNSEQLDVDKLLCEVVLLLGRTLRKNIDIRLLPSQGECYVRADAAALEHALLNLALNAQDAMPNGGTLSFCCRRQDVDACTAAALGGELAPGPAVVLTVTDTGRGMTEEVRARMFEPFFTTKQPGQGTGLGLAAVHGTIHGHGGAIAAASSIGLGTTFDLYLPAVERQRPALAQRAQAPISKRIGALRARVLLAEDEALVREATAAMLESFGCEVKIVEDGTALVDALAEGPRPELVVSDLAMPGLGGVHLVRTLEAIMPDGPLLLITGFSGDDVSKTCPPRRSRQLLRKPFTRSELQQAVFDLLGGSLARATTA